jgi:hypothetical protein
VSDTGPLYPPGPLPGSNSIGSFVIGTSPIGDIPPFDVWKTIISQYANSAILTQLIENLDEYVDQTANFDSLYDLIWNVDSAQGYGLDVWGRIVGVTRVLTISSTKFFGFEQQAPAVDTFGPGGTSPFYVGVSATSNFSLTDSAFRTLIFAKALANICDGSIPAINQILLNLFPGRGDCYVTDGQNMTMTYTFKFALTPVEVAIVSSSGVLPKPVGVAATVVQDF